MKNIIIYPNITVYRKLYFNNLLLYSIYHIEIRWNNELFAVQLEKMCCKKLVWKKGTYTEMGVYLQKSTILGTKITIVKYIIILLCTLTVEPKVKANWMRKFCVNEKH